MNAFRQTNRLARLLIVGVAALLISCSAQVDESGTPRRVANDLKQLMTSIAQTELAFDPELATRLGLSEKAAGYAFDQYLTDRSQAAYERVRVTRLETLETLEQAERPAAGSALARDLETLIAAYKTAESLAVFGNGQTQLGGAYPYAADHMRGAYIDIPDLLINAQPVRSLKEAQAYVSRLALMEDALDDERRRLLADADAGIIPPAVIVTRMRAITRDMTAEPPESHKLVTHLSNLMAGSGNISQEDQRKLISRAQTELSKKIYPAYERFDDTLRVLGNRASDVPGVWQLPQGQAYYAAALKAYTVETVEPAEIHQFGLEAVAALSKELDFALTNVGLTEGSVAQRLYDLSQSEEHVFSDDTEGRTALLARINRLIAKGESAMQGQLGKPIETPVVANAVPDFLETSAPAAVYTPAPANGSAPGLFTINLQSIADWPDFTLPTLVFHETIPGHHVEASVAAEQAELPLARQLIWNSAYGEGWGMYAETLANDLGLYEDDPYGYVGFLQSQLFRAARLVADTGLHHERWTRPQAIEYLVAVTGQSPDTMTDEIDRYTVWPGQATAYWIGQRYILDLREQAEHVLGPDFDAAAFHDVILKGGPRPLHIVDADVNAWYTAQIR